MNTDDNINIKGHVMSKPGQRKSPMRVLSVYLKVFSKCFFFLPDYALLVIHTAYIQSWHRESILFPFHWIIVLLQILISVEL